MSPEEFVIWLKGVYSSADTSPLTKKQSGMIKKMLAEVVFTDYNDMEEDTRDMPDYSIWETHSTAHSSINKILIEYRED
jgi:hypothetical protein